MDAMLHARLAQENGSGGQCPALSGEAVFVAAVSARQPGDGKKGKAGRSRHLILRPGLVLYSHPDPVVVIAVVAKDDPRRNLDTGKHIFNYHFTQLTPLAFCFVSVHNINITFLKWKCKKHKYWE